MKLKDLGEFAFIDRFCRPLGSEMFGRNEAEVKGIGDDCAVVRIDETTAQLVTTDLLVEGTHFLFSESDPYDLGYKSLAVNLSDIAAMGGKPSLAFLALALPPALEEPWLEQFFQGWKALAQETGVILAGGDTTSTNANITIGVTIVGEAQLDQIKYRSGALLGDRICVTDFLGDSAGGLEVVLRKLPRDSESGLVKRHFRPRPQLAEGKWLAAQGSVHAMIDISDGIDSDIRRIMAESNCGALVELENLPCSAELRRFCASYELDPLLLAATGGEDYCLMFTASFSEIEALKEGFVERFGSPLYEIGEINDRAELLEYRLAGENMILSRHGWDSFKSRS